MSYVNSSGINPITGSSSDNQDQARSVDSTKNAVPPPTAKTHYRKQSQTSSKSSSSDRNHYLLQNKEEEFDALGFLHDDSDSSMNSKDANFIDNRGYNDSSKIPKRRKAKTDAVDSRTISPAANQRKPKSRLSNVVAASSSNSPFTESSYRISPTIQRENLKPMKQQQQQQQKLERQQSMPAKPILKKDSKVQSNSQHLTYASENPYDIETPVSPRYSKLHQSNTNQGRTYGRYSIASHSSNTSSTMNSSDDNGEESYASSNPSSRRSSDTSSLHDVCFPVDSLDDTGKKKIWPNIQVLEEFAQEELDEARRINEASELLDDVISEEASAVGFQYPLISKIETGVSRTSENTPLLTSFEQDIDPTDTRIRSSRTTPWDNVAKNENNYELNIRRSRLEKMRYTYFREDLDNTIHAPNISGLVQDGKYTFQDLFSPSFYATKTSNTTIAEENNRDSTPQVSLTAVNSSLNLKQQQKLNILSLQSVGSGSVVTDSTAGNSNASAEEIEPFWLDVLSPTEEEMKVLSKTFGIHPLTTEDIFLGETREKVELFKDYYLVCFTSFDVVQERNRKKLLGKAFTLQQQQQDEHEYEHNTNWFQKVLDSLGSKVKSNKSEKSSTNSSYHSGRKSNASLSSRATRHKQKKNELKALNMYMIVFRYGIITFHAKPTPHPTNVRRRARLLRDYLNVTADWIAYALIDDVTDAFAPLIDSIEEEVNAIEDSILRMQSGSDSEDDTDDELSDDEEKEHIWFKMKRRNSTVNGQPERASVASSYSSNSTSSSSAKTKIISWKRKGDMLRRIGDCRKRVMSLLRLLGFKADVIKGFSKRCNEQWEVAPRSEIGMYLGDIQDHIVTMVQSLNHYEKLLARSHSNYLAQINIDMTKVNNDMNDILGKITILGTIVLPLNVVTGLWGMNCLVPGQDVDSLTWFWGIVGFMAIFSFMSYYLAKKVSGIV